MVTRVGFCKPGGSLSLVALACRCESSHNTLIAVERENIYKQAVAMTHAYRAGS